MAALRASRLVWSAMSEMTSMTEPMPSARLSSSRMSPSRRCEMVRTRSMASLDPLMILEPSSAMRRDSSALWAAVV